MPVQLIEALALPSEEENETGRDLLAFAISVESDVGSATFFWEIVGLIPSWARTGTTVGVTSKASPTIVAESDLRCIW